LCEINVQTSLKYHTLLAAVFV